MKVSLKIFLILFVIMFLVLLIPLYIQIKADQDLEFNLKIVKDFVGQTNSDYETLNRIILWENQNINDFNDNTFWKSWPLTFRLSVDNKIYYRNTGQDNPIVTLSTKTGQCGEFASLFVYLASKFNISCVRVCARTPRERDNCNILRDGHCFAECSIDGTNKTYDPYRNLMNCTKLKNHIETSNQTCMYYNEILIDYGEYITSLESKC